jgi:hypothetical protein
MSVLKRVRLGGLIALAMALSVVAVLGWGHTQAPPSHAGEVGAMAVDCDAATAGVQTDCSHAPGSTFSVQVHVTSVPTDGYFGFQTKLRWDEGTTNYLPTEDPADEALWAECDVPARQVNPDLDPPDPSVLYACIPFPALTSGDTTTGAVLQFEMNCKTDFTGISHASGVDPNQSLLRLVPRVGDDQLGTHFLDVATNPIDPDLSGDAIVTCEEPPPVPTATATTPGGGGGPTATPTPKPGVNISGDTSIEVGETTELTVTLLDENLDPVADATCDVSIASQPGTSASVAPASITTDADGQATVTVTGGTTPGVVSVEVDCGDFGSETLDVTVSPAALPGTGGAGDSSSSLWIVMGAVLVAAAAAVGVFGWRFVGSRPTNS